MTECGSIADMAHNIASQLWKQCVSQNVSPVTAVETSNSRILQKVGLAWVPSFAPGFYLNSKQVKILHEPQSFYKLLLQQIRKATKRIVLASLYLGTGPLEKDLVYAVKARLEENPGLKVKVLLDCMRGSRGEINSRKMLLPLLKNYKGSCEISLYQTPSLQGSLIHFLPVKYKEILGLHHLKAYLFDDNVIITGANLSNDYFTNRQDRYLFLKESKNLSDFIEGLVNRVSDFSYHLDSEDKLSLSKNWPHDPSKTDPKIFNAAASTWIRNYYESFLGNEEIEAEDDTVIFPLLEMGPFNIHVDSTVTTNILEKTDNETNVYLTTGYFNLTDSYINTIIKNSKAKYKILMAHPTANGFYKAEGLAGGIPHAYTNLALKFLKKVNLNREFFRIRLYEYKRPRWTYHAKGLWLSTPDFEIPFLTMVGSPNFGERSVKHDLECQFLLATTSEELQSELLHERKLLYDSCKFFSEDCCSDPERQTPLWVKVVVWLFRSYL